MHLPFVEVLLYLIIFSRDKPHKKDRTAYAPYYTGFASACKQLRLSREMLMISRLHRAVSYTVAALYP